MQLTSLRLVAPCNVVAYVAAQLGSRDLACLADYATGPSTARKHGAEIRHVYGYRALSDPGASFRLVRWLCQRPWLSTEPPRVVFDLATRCKVAIGR